MSAHKGDELRIVSELLLDGALEVAGDRPWLVLGGEAALVEELTTSTTRVEWMPVDSRERDMASGNVVACDAVSIDAYDRALLPIPPDRDLARRLLLAAHTSLRSGGLLLIAGANAEGAKSVMADATALFGPAVADSYRQKHRIARFTRRDESSLPSRAEKDGLRPGTWQRFTVTIDGIDIELETRPGVFAGNRLDAGTALLLHHPDIQEGSRVLDVGCGAGVIGVAASLRGASHVDMVDPNLLAVQAAARNMERLAIPGRALPGDVYDPVSGDRYNLIVSNPPFHRGKAVDLSVADRLISQAPAHLLPGGRILIVANAFLAYGKQMQRVFRNVETVAATRQYHLLAASDPR